jgi:hypothetical protein
MVVVNCGGQAVIMPGPHSGVGRKRGSGHHGDMRLLSIPNVNSPMVPGLSERERRAADVQRLKWLADAVLGPARSSGGRPS